MTSPEDHSRGPDVPPGSTPPDDQTPPKSAKVVLLVFRLFLLGFGAAWLSGVTAMLYGTGKDLHGELRKAFIYRPVAAEVTLYTPAEIDYKYVVAGREHAGTYRLPGSGAARNEFESALPDTPAVGQKITAVVAVGLIE